MTERKQIRSFFLPIKKRSNKKVICCNPYLSKKITVSCAKRILYSTFLLNPNESIHILNVVVHLASIPVPLKLKTHVPVVYILCLLQIRKWRRDSMIHPAASVGPNPELDFTMEQ